MQYVDALEPKEGYTKSNKTFNQNGDGSVSVRVYYTRNKNKLTTGIVDEETGSVTSYTNELVKYEEEVTVNATPNTGYEFYGWFDGDRIVSENTEYTFTMPNNDLSLVAEFRNKKYFVNVDSTGYEYSWDNLLKVEYGGNLNIPVPRIINRIYSTDSVFEGWMYNDTLITDNKGDLLNNWDIDQEDITVTPKFKDPTCIYFGTYPQNGVVTSLVPGLPSIKFDADTWTDYGYYVNGEASSYMYYIDVDLDSDESYDYRGVYFTKYRPYYYSGEGSVSYSYQDNNEYNPNNIYWFKYEPIKWNILESNDGKAFIISNLLLDSQCFNINGSSRLIDDNTIYANNYMYSYIREWLNDDFYNTAFNSLEKEIIELTAVDNSASTTYNTANNKYACDSTNDNIFLLSYQESIKYYETDSLRTAKTTDYATCQGAFMSLKEGFIRNGCIWLRSPATTNNYDAYMVNQEGNLCATRAYFAQNGIRPACWIDL